MPREREATSNSDEEQTQYSSLNQAIKLLKISFDGKKSELREFINSVETAISEVHPDQQKTFLKFIEAQITGEAKTKLLSRPDRRTWQDVRKILEENYASRRTIDYYANRLFNSKQMPNEDVASWASRIDTMARDISDGITRVMNPVHQSGAFEFLRLISKSCFVNGLHDDKIMTVLRAQNELATLPNLIELALETESSIITTKLKKNDYRATNYTRSGKENQTRDHQGRRNDYRDFKKGNRTFNVNLVCFRCQKEGHIAKDCRGSPKCRMCNKLGHLTKDCRMQSRQGNGL